MRRLEVIFRLLRFSPVAGLWGTPRFSGHASGQMVSRFLRSRLARAGCTRACRDQRSTPSRRRMREFCATGNPPPHPVRRAGHGTRRCTRSPPTNGRRPSDCLTSALSASARTETDGAIGSMPVNRRDEACPGGDGARLGCFPWPGGDGPDAVRTSARSGWRAVPPSPRARTPIGRSSGRRRAGSSGRAPDSPPGRRARRTRSRQDRVGQPSEEPKRGPAGAGADHRDRERQHADQRQAEHGVERDLPTQLLQRRAEQRRAEDQEGDPAEQGSELFVEAGGFLRLLTDQCSEDAAREERRDEARSAQGDCDPVGQSRRRRSGLPAANPQ